jgi:hypothetical protein
MQYRQLGAISLHRSDELVLDLLLDCLQPVFGASSAPRKKVRLALKFDYPLLCGSQLHCQLVRQTHGSVEVFIRDVRGFPQHSDESVPRSIDRVASILWPLLRG